MTIFILRHGQAEIQITTDGARQLTDKGRGDTDKVLRARAGELASIFQIWASPLVRAQQTATIAANYFPQLSIQTTDLLVPEANPQALMEWLDALNSHHLQGSNKSILLVSHQPLVGSLVNKLCGKLNNYYPMHTSSLAAIRVPVIAGGMGDLIWLDHA
jgi:phosphohistidine phosphatase